MGEDLWPMWGLERAEATATTEGIEGLAKRRDSKRPRRQQNWGAIKTRH